MLKHTHSPSPARAHLLASRAQSHRRSLTEPERRLWAELSRSKFGVAFRRQVVLGNAIANFFAPSLRLVIEVDGAHHRHRRTADARRDRDLRRLGCEVLRVDALLVLRDLPRAVALIRAALAALPDPPNPLSPP
jgi:very-short-patch-repair endonuclease